MGKPGRHIRFKLHLFQDPGNELFSFFFGAHFMHLQSFADDLFNREPWRQGGKRILKDDLQLFAQGTHPGAGKRVEVNGGVTPAIENFSLATGQFEDAHGKGTFS